MHLQNCLAARLVCLMIVKCLLHKLNVLPSDEFSDSDEETIEELNGGEKKGKNKKVSDTPTSTADRTFSSGMPIYVHVDAVHVCLNNFIGI